MNKKVLVYLCCLILFISVSLNIFFISYSNNVKRSTNLIINNMVNLVENKYSGVVVEDIIKELNSSELKETSLSKYGIDISDFISLKMKNDNLKYLIILNIIVTCLSLFIIIYNLILKSYKNKKIEELTDLIKEELNVKEVMYTNETSDYLTYTVKPNFKEVGKLFGKNIGEFSKFVSEFTSEDIKNIESKTVTYDGVTYNLNKSMLDIRVSAKEGYDVTSDGVNFVILDTTITPELKDEGILRDLIRQCQVLRKNIGLDISDRISIEFNTTEELTNNIINKYESVISSELLATIEKNNGEVSEYIDEEGNKFEVKIEKK